MRKIAVTNLKGGTGKTTTAINLGAGLAMRGQRVLLVDLDAGDLGLSLGLSYSCTLTDALVQESTIQDCLIGARANLDVLPSDNAIRSVGKVIASYVNWREVLGDVLAPIQRNYDFVILDCTATLSVLNVNALNYASECLVPTQMEYLPLASLNQLLENLAQVRFPSRPRNEVIDLGISLFIPTMYDTRSHQSRRLHAQMSQTFGSHVGPPVRFNKELSEAPSYGKTIYEYAPKSRGALDYNLLVDVVLEAPPSGDEPIGLQHTFRPAPDQPIAEPAQLPQTTPEGIEIPETEGSEPSQGDSPEELPDWARAPRSVAECPICKSPLNSFTAAGYRILSCDRCGYQKQSLLRDLRER